MLFNISKKGLAPLVAVMLLLIVAAVAGVALQNWYTDFTSKSLTQAESQTSESLTLTKIMDNVNGTIYFRNGYNTNLSISDVRIGDKSCGITSIAIPGMNTISLGNCSQNLTSYRNELKIYTDKGVYTKFVYFSEGIPTDVVSLNGEEGGGENVSVSNSDYYLLTNSLMLNDDDSQYLSWTPVIEGNRTTWTWSGWVKRGNLSSQGAGQRIMGVFEGSDDSEWLSLSFYGGSPINSLIFSGYSTLWRVTNAVYRDSSSWMHIVLSVDTTLPIANDRIKIYVDGKQVTSFNQVNNPSQYSQLGINRLGSPYNLSSSSYSFDGYLSEIHFIDGVALNASYFGQNDSYGNWVPKEFNVTNTSKGTYGPNGFYLPFNDSFNLGRDYSTEKPNDYTKLLIHSNTTDGSTTFLDYTGRNSITANGNTHHEIDASKFGTSSIYFDGTGDYLSVSSSDLDIYGEDFTIDFWINTSSTSEGAILDLHNSGNSYYSTRIYMSTSGTLQPIIGSTSDGGSGTQTFDGSYSSSAINDGNWHHVALVSKANGNSYLFVDGNLEKSSTTGTRSTTLNTLFLGAEWYGSSVSSYSTNYIDEFRITKGKALWTDEFTPDTSPALPINKPQNKFTLNNVDEGGGLLIHSNTSSGDTRFEDSSGREHIITANGNVNHNSSTGKFGNSSIYFDGSGDYLSIPDSSDWAFGSEDFTIDTWIKRDGNPGTQGYILNSPYAVSGGNGYNYYSLRLDTAGKIKVYVGIDSGNTASITSSSSVTDNSWHHVAMIRNGDNLSVYIDGTYEGSDSIDFTISYPSGGNLKIGTVWDASGTHLSAYLDEFRITKGKALWTGEFTAPTSLATILDSPSDDQVIDTPTNNFATMNPLSLAGTAPTLSLGNLRVDSNTIGQYGHARSTLPIPSTGKYYFKALINAEQGTGGNPIIGIASDYSDWSDMANNNQFYTFVESSVSVTMGGGVYINSSLDNTYTAFDEGDYMHFAMDMDSKDMWIGYSSSAASSITWFGGGDPSLGTSPTANEVIDSNKIYFPAISVVSGGGPDPSAATFDFLDKDETAPEGFKSISVNNIRSNYDDIVPSDYFDVITYTGNGAVRNITGLSFSPDLVWIKNRDTTDEHKLIDSLRGATYELSPDSGTTESTNSNGLTNFLSNGFSLGTGADGYNDNTEDFVAWNWKENTNLGFDIVEYNGTGSASTAVAHNLNKTPDFFFVKDRNSNGVWMAYHKSYGAQGPVGSIDDTFAAYVNNNLWTSTEPNSTHFTVGVSSHVNEDGDPFIAYLFTEKGGFSKFGSYIGNGNADGPFIYTGFKPKFVMIKNIDSTYRWVMQDTERMPHNGIGSKLLAADYAGAENVNPPFNHASYDENIDFLSNGFKLNTDGVSGNTNDNGNEYIYIAFAEVPMAGIPSPYLNFTSNSTTVEVNSSIYLTWDSRYTSSCVASGDWSGTKNTTGSLEVSVTDSQTYTLTCTNGIKNETQSVTITALQPTKTFDLTYTLDNPDYYNSTGDRFGYSVAMSDNYAIVSTHYEDYSSGSSSGIAYVFNPSNGTLLYNLSNPNDYDTPNGDQFGYSVSLSGDYLIVGAWKEDDVSGLDSGKAYIFNLSNGSLLYTLDNPNDYSTSAYDRFGESVAITSTHIIVSAKTEDDASGVDSGKVYVFNISDGSSLYTIDNPNDYGTSANDHFGSSISLNEKYILVGAGQEDDASGSNSGRGYIFNISDGSLLYTLDNPNAYGTPYSDNFGFSTSINNENYGILSARLESEASGSNSGKAYVFNVSNGSLIYTINNPNNYSTVSDDYFGSSLSLSESYAIVGAYGEDDTNGTTSGKAYIFNITDGSLLYTLDNPNAYGTSADDEFGRYGVGISENYGIVSAHQEDDVGDTNSGKAYIFG